MPTAAAFGPGGRSLFVRRLEDREPQPLKGAENGKLPFFSPDGRRVGFFDGKLCRVPLEGGSRQPVIIDPDWAAGDLVFGGAWGADNRVVFGGGYLMPGIWRAAAEGGTPEALVKGDAGAFYQVPDVLPEDKGIVFAVYRGGRSSVHAWSSTSGAREVLPHASRARYLATGQLLYEEGGSLRIVDFDADTLRTRGQPRVAVEDVETTPDTAAWDVSRTGTLVFAPPYAGLRRLVWRTRRGEKNALPLKDGPYQSVSLSPDNQRLVVGMREGLRCRLWWGRLDGDNLQPLTYGYDDRYNVFSPDGRWVLFARLSDTDSVRDEHHVIAKCSHRAGASYLLVSGNREIDDVMTVHRSRSA